MMEEKTNVLNNFYTPLKNKLTRKSFKVSILKLPLPLRHLRARPRRKITGKERDSETGLYYYGARYLDPKASRWLSGDPAVGEYIPSAPVSDEARKRNGNLPGMGGVFNYANLHIYHYAGNNPVKYVDPDGKQQNRPPLLNGYGVTYRTNSYTTINGYTIPSFTITPCPMFEQIEGYSGLTGAMQSIGEIFRGASVMRSIEAYHAIIVSAAEKHNVDPNLIRAVIYEEQTHNKTPNLEGAFFISSVGPMAVNRKHWGELTRANMLNPNTNILVGTSLLRQSINRVTEGDQEPSIAQIASNYNNENAVTVTTDYGRRVELFYNWFVENYEE